MNTGKKSEKKPLQLAIWQKTGSLSAESRAFIAELDASTSAQKYTIHPPSIIVGIYLVIFALLFFVGAFFAAHSMFVEKAMDGYGYKMAVLILFPVIGLLSGAVGLKMDVKRFGSKKYYLFLHDEALVERSFRHVSIIPRASLKYAYERTALRVEKSDLYYDSVVYQDDSGKLWLYDLKDHYYSSKVKRHSGHDNIYARVQKHYGIPQAPPQKHFAHRI